jgi:hypothetical protein
MKRFKPKAVAASAKVAVATFEKNSMLESI